MEILELEKLTSMTAIKLIYMCAVLIPILITILVISEKYLNKQTRQPTGNKITKPLLINWCIFIPVIIVVSISHTKQVNLRDAIQDKITNLDYYETTLNSIITVNKSKYCNKTTKVKLSNCYRIYTEDATYLIYLNYDEHKKLGEGTKIKVSDLTDKTAYLLTDNFIKLSKQIDSNSIVPIGYTRELKTYFAKLE